MRCSRFVLFIGLTTVLFGAENFLSGDASEIMELLRQASAARTEAKFRDAKVLYEKALARLTSTSSPKEGASQNFHLAALNGLAMLAHDEGIYSEARTYAESGLNWIETNHLQESADAATTFAALGMIYEAQGAPRESEVWWIRSLAIREKLFGKNAKTVADTRVGLALAFRRQSRLKEAADYYQYAVAIYERDPSGSGKSLPVALNNLGRVFLEQGNAKQAEEYFRKAIAAWEKSSGPQGPDIASGLTSLGILLSSTNRYSEAEPLLRRAIDIDRTALPAAHPKIGYDLHNLAVLEMSRKRWVQAQKLLEDAEQILQNSLPANHIEIGKLLARLAEVHHKLGHLDESEVNYRAALEVLDPNLGTENPALLPLLEDYSEVSRSRNNFATAAALDSRVMRIRVKQTLAENK